MRKPKIGSMLLITGWLLTAWNQFHIAYKKHQEKTNKEIHTTLKSKHQDIEITERGPVSPELIEDDNGHPVGSIIINNADKDTVLNQLYDKYKEIFWDEELNISIEFYKQVETILQSQEKNGERLCFETQMIWEKRILSKAYLYKKPEWIPLQTQ